MGCRLRLVGLVVAAVLAVGAFCAPLGAAESTPVESTPGRLTVGEPAADAEAVESHDRLKASVRPLTEQELADLATVWRDRLKDKVREISDLRTGAAAAAPAVAPGSALSRLQEERTILTDRLRVVLDEWERKGGDPKEFRLYASAVNGLEMDVTNAGTALVILRNWLLSPQGGIRWLGNIIRFLVILFASWMLSNFLSSLTGRAIAQVKGASSLLRTFLVNFVRQATLLVGLVVSLSALEINTSPLLALIGGAAFVVGLALQGTLANFAQGLLILAYRPFDVGDVIDAAGVSGIVDSMNMLSTTIRTFDNKLMIVPNGKIGGDTITNATASATRRVDLTFGIGYDDDIDAAQAILERIVGGHPLVLQDPAPVIKLNELADSSINFVVRPWAKTGDYWTVYWDVTAAVKREFDKAGVSIPYPQRDVHVYQAPAPGRA
jgi:small conductance mechanosensitive channel